MRLEEDPTGRSVELDRGIVEETDRLIDAAVGAGEGAALLSFLNPMVQGRGAGDVVLYAAAYLQTRSGDRTVAQQLFSHLCEQLEQRLKWEGLGPVLERVLSHAGTPDFARVAARLWEKSGDKYATVSLLRRAHELNDGDYRISRALGSSLIEANDAEGYILLARSLPGAAAKKETDRVEEGVLQIMEKPDRSSLLLCLEALDVLVRADIADPTITIFEMTYDTIVEHGLAGESWTILRHALEHVTDVDAFRDVACAAGIAAHSNIRDPEKLFGYAGIADRKRPVDEALATLDRLLEIPPGRHAAHYSWGVGEILENNGERIKIQFTREGIRDMSVSLAKTALILLDPTDLRTKVHLDRRGMMSALKENQSEFLFHTLQHLGGEATQDEVRRVLITLDLLVSTEWAEWWKQAKKGAADDERFDMSQLFRKVIRLRREGGNGIVLPEVDLSTKMYKGLGLLLKFLDQHPDDVGELIRRYGDELKTRAGEKKRAPSERVQAHLLLRRAGHFNEEEFREAFTLFAGNPDLMRFNTDQQKELLESAPEEKKRETAMLLLDSKVQAVRREAWSVVESLGGTVLEKVVMKTLGNSPNCGNAVLHVIRRLVGNETFSQWSLLDPLIHLIENPEKDTHRRNALEILDSENFHKALAGAEPSEAEAGYLRNRLLHWKHSERYLFPILALLKGTPLAAVADEVNEQRQALHATAEAGVYDRFDGRILMTTITLTRLRKEVEDLDWDMKTSIPQEIRKARELGDLRENAEFDAAKKRQADTSVRLEELYNRLRLATSIEEIEILPDEAGPGMEVELRADGGETEVYWILGEGDRMLGEEVISYRAPLGEMLMGKRVGDEVGPLGDKQFRIVSLRKRLPEAMELEE